MLVGITGGAGGQHLQSQCPKLLQKMTCQKCFKKGHAASHCRGAPLDTKACKRCGETGHYKRECALNTNSCQRCHVKWHTLAVCRLPPGPAPKPKQQEQQPQQKTGHSKAQQQSPATVATLCEACGPENAHEYKWICESCGCLVKDDGNTATKCPGCSVARGKKRKQSMPPRRASCRK